MNDNKGTAVVTLCVDMIGSTREGLDMSTVNFDWFNQSLPTQFKRHVDGLGLAPPNVLIKFGGDGWLVMSSSEHDLVFELCTLALIMRDRFQLDMRELTQGALAIPKLRIAICVGRDIHVSIPGGGSDWVGDSARLAVRASGYCFPNEILVNDGVRLSVERDFSFRETNLKDPTRTKPKAEEQLQKLFVLENDKGVAREGPRIRACYSYLNSVLGRVERVETPEDGGGAQELLRQWGKLFARLPDYDSMEQMVRKMRSSGLELSVVFYNMLINRAPDYARALDWNSEIKKYNLQADVITFTTLIKRSLDFATAQQWWGCMKEAGIAPNLITFNTFLQKAEQHADIGAIVREMADSRVKPNRDTGYILLVKDAGYAVLRCWLLSLLEAGLKPDRRFAHKLISKLDSLRDGIDALELLGAHGLTLDGTLYAAVFAKPTTGIEADAVFGWYIKGRVRSEGALDALIANLSESQRFEDVTRVVLEYPHLRASAKVMREHNNELIPRFERLFAGDPNHRNAAYALGIAMSIAGNTEQARFYLDRAKMLPNSKARTLHIKQILANLSGAPGA